MTLTPTTVTPSKSRAAPGPPISSWCAISERSSDFTDPTSRMVGRAPFELRSILNVIHRRPSVARVCKGGARAVPVRSKEEASLSAVSILFPSPVRAIADVGQQPARHPLCSGECLGPADGPSSNCQASARPPHSTVSAYPAPFPLGGIGERIRIRPSRSSALFVGTGAGASATRPACGYDVAMMDTHGAASGAITAPAVADGETAGRPDLDLDELTKAEAERRRMLDNLPVLSWRGLPDGSKDFFSLRWHHRAVAVGVPIRAALVGTPFGADDARKGAWHPSGLDSLGTIVPVPTQSRGTESRSELAHPELSLCSSDGGVLAGAPRCPRSVRRWP